MPRPRPQMRVIEVEPDHRNDRWLLWMLAGAAIGVTGGVLVAEKFSGRRPSAHTLVRRVRGLSKAALAQWGPMLDLALQVKEIWDDRQATAREDDDEYDDEYDDADDEDALADADEYEEADPPARALVDDEDEDEELEDDEELDEDSDEDSDEDDDAAFDEDLDEDIDDIDDVDDEEDELEDDAPEIGVRVLEAFSHDPVLAARAIEIEADDEGAVLLHGTVHTSREVSHAVTIARGVPGVTRVRQRLAVRGRR